MTLHKLESPESLLARLHRTTPKEAVKYRVDLANNHVGTELAEPIPKFEIAQDGQPGDISYQKITEDLDLDGKPTLNLASFVNTDLDDISIRLAKENITKNLSDSDEYPGMMALHGRCVSIISHLWNVPRHLNAVGTATTGSSEAIHLGGLAMKRTWEKKNGYESGQGRPNIIMGANAQVALEKFARYFDVEARILPVSKDYGYSFDYTTLKDHVDENTIGVFAILGSTYTGHYQDVESISNELDKIQKEKGWDIPIHVDGASGGFIAPFCTPKLKWDFRLPRVVSINTSGHKFGLTSAGCGWVIWKDVSYLPDNLLFTLRYLGGAEESYTLNFSRPGFPVILQYFNLVRLGFNGYKDLHEKSLENARLFSKFLEATGYFHVYSEVHVKDSDGQFRPSLPVVAFGFNESFKKKYPELPQEAIAHFLRTKGYIIPNYPLPENCSDKEVLRVVVRASLSADLLDKLMEDIAKTVTRLTNAVEQYRTNVQAKTEAPIQLHQLLGLIVAVSGDETEHEKDWVKHGHKHRGTIC